MRTIACFLIVTALSCFLSCTCHAQPVNDEGLWLAALGNGNLSDRCCANKPVMWWFDAHCRLLDDTSGFNQSIIRPGLGLDLGNDATLWSGYAWIFTSPISGEDFDEHRIWQQFTWAPSVRQMNFQVRSRFEQRFVEGGDDVGLRWRQLFRAQGREIQGTGISPVVWDEFFFNLNDTDWGASSGFDQNRVFAGFRLPGARRFSKIRPEIGYLNQVINEPGPNRTNHILSVNFFF